MVMAVVILCWGLGPPVAKLITAPAVISTLYRFWISVPILFGAAILLGVRPGLSTLRRAAIPGAAFGINLVFVFLTINASAVAVLAVVTALQPAVILLVAGRFLGERPKLWHVVWTLVGIGGTAVVVLGAGADFEVTGLGLLYAVAAMITFTIYFLGTRKVRHADPDLHPVAWMAGIALAAALTVTPWALATSSAADYRAVAGLDWVWLGFMILITGAAGHVLMAWTHHYIEASRSSLYLLSMNVVAIAGAWVIHDEPLAPLQLLGGAVVFASVAAVISRPAAPDAEIDPDADAVTEAGVAGRPTPA